MMGYFASTLVVISMMGASTPSTNWESDYGKALAATKQEKRPLLVVLEVPSEAGKHLNVQENDKKGPLDAYELCRVDVSTEYGKKVAKAFKVTTFPHVAIIDKTGENIIFRKTGAVNEQEWNTILVDHKEGVVPHVVFKPNTGIFDPNYCPACQNAQKW